MRKLVESDKLVSGKFFFDVMPLAWAPMDVHATLSFSFGPSVLLLIYYYILVLIYCEKCSPEQP